jgi:2'-5' RNA ligase
MPFEFSVARTFEIAVRLADELHQGLAQDLITAKAREAEKSGSSFRPKTALGRVKQAGNLVAWIKDMKNKTVRGEEPACSFEAEGHSRGALERVAEVKGARNG